MNPRSQKPGEEVWQELEGHFPVWFRTAAEVTEVHLGKVVRFSDSLLFFPDCRVVLGGDIYLRGGRLADVRIPLLVDRDQLLTDLLDHSAGTFVYPGNTIEITATWEQAGSAQVKDYLWYALENWFITLSHRVEFEVGMDIGHLAESADFPGCRATCGLSLNRLSSPPGRRAGGENQPGRID